MKQGAQEYFQVPLESIKRKENDNDNTRNLKIFGIK